MRFQAGGVVRADAVYVRRDADDELPEALLRGELCRVFAPRQMGKSSLRVRTTKRLADRGVRVATVDLTAIGTAGAAIDPWLYGVASEIAAELGLEAPAWAPLLPPVQRWSDGCTGSPDRDRWSCSSTSSTRCAGCRSAAATCSAPSAPCTTRARTTLPGTTSPSA
jgi:hypothetical protein